MSSPSRTRPGGPGQANISRTAWAAHERIHVLARVVEPERRARRRREPEPLHERLRTVVAGADGDPVAIEHGADVVQVHVADEERHRARPLARRADEANVPLRRERVHRVREEPRSCAAIDSGPSASR